MGQNITIIGLFVQLIFFGVFSTVSIISYQRVEKSKGVRTLHMPYGVLLYVLFMVSALIIIRCLYRIVEFCQDNNGYLMSHGMFLNVFYTIPMSVVQAIFHYYHPEDVFPLKGSFAESESELS